MLYFRECNKMMERSKFSEEEQKSHFETGVKMGVGTFNLVSIVLVHEHASEKARHVHALMLEEYFQIHKHLYTMS